MQMKRKSKPYAVTLKYGNGLTRTVMVTASNREVAERRALKRNVAATGIQKGD